MRLIVTGSTIFRLASFHFVRLLRLLGNGKVLVNDADTVAVEAIASDASVTVSIADEQRNVRAICREKRVRVSTRREYLEKAGTRNTSSKVRPIVDLVDFNI